MPSSDERLFASLIYVTSLFTTIIGPLIIWIIKKDQSSFVDYHGRQYFNFIISYFIYTVIAGVLTLVLIGAILLPIIGIAGFVFTIVAAVKAYEGSEYRIPLIFRIL